jgi:hypothetical protein
MAANINLPIAWETAVGDDLTMLDETQANILAATQARAIPRAVRLLGGKYFFMPSLAFLRSL